ncbi:hypothetical protein PIB30_073594 [Stylosanthes scabra]|uniref:Uncharacterized protein n=1 Tax=Stylosanthes scabra TaxID=79078 RepID=A0ABU6URP7_9FABA|nr:hypothetical protein [Stylosanthes scabra]
MVVVDSFMSPSAAAELLRRYQRPPRPPSLCSATAATSPILSPPSLAVAAVDSDATATIIKLLRRHKTLAIATVRSASCVNCRNHSSIFPASSLLN